MSAMKRLIEDILYLDEEGYSVDKIAFIMGMSEAEVLEVIAEYSEIIE